MRYLFILFIFSSWGAAAQPAIVPNGNIKLPVVGAGSTNQPTNYYADSVSGSDENSGTSSNSPWKSLARLNATTFKSGDNIFLKAGSSWTGQLHPPGSGDSNGQVTVDMYSSGTRPMISAGGIAGGAFSLHNQQYWSINNLDLSNYGSTNVAKKWGIYIVNDSAGTLNGIYVNNCYIHDVNGVMDNYKDGKESGGIVFSINGSNTNNPSNWNDIRVVNNTIRDVARSGILMRSFFVNKLQNTNSCWPGLGLYYPSTRVYIAGNTLLRIGGDGILTCVVNGAVVEHNYLQQANHNTPNQAHAGIWPYFCENVIFQYNEVCDTETKFDGMAFNYDNSNEHCIYQYNYSHDNQGGFLSMCSGGDSHNNIFRYNISQNDGCLTNIRSRVFLIYGGGNHNNSIYNNTVFVSKNSPMLFQDDGGGSSNSTVNYYNNIFINQGSGSVKAPAGCFFDHNLFFGNGYISSDTNRLMVNPQIVAGGSAANGLASVTGYKLMANSPAFHAGVVITNNGGKDYWQNPVSATAAPNPGADNGMGVPEMATVRTNQITW